MNIRTANIDGRIVDIINEEEFKKYWETYSNPSISSSIAVEVNEDNNRFILPFRGKNDDRPGIYQDGCIYFVKKGNKYSKNNIDIVDFGDANNIQDFINKNSQIRKMENTNLTEIDSVFSPMIDQNDSPEMKAFKKAIQYKHIDINKYAPRFGDNFLNDKRILKSNSITLNKLISMCQNLDIEAKLTLKDSSPEVPNPMKEQIEVILTKEGDDE